MYRYMYVETSMFMCFYTRLCKVYVHLYMYATYL